MVAKDLQAHLYQIETKYSLQIKRSYGSSWTSITMWTVDKAKRLQNLSATKHFEWFYNTVKPSTKGIKILGYPNWALGIELRAIFVP